MKLFLIAFGVLALATIVGLSAYLVTTSRSSSSAHAGARELADVDLGLTINVSPSDQTGKTNVHASWNQIPNPPSNSVLSITVRTGNGIRGLISDSNEQIVNISDTSKDFINLDLPDGDYYVQLRLIPTSGKILRQIYSFSLPPKSTTGANLFKNSSFEQGIIPSENQDLDPIDWIVKEGLFKILPGGGESGDVVTQYPRMSQTVNAENGVRPHSGSFMLKNATRRGSKSQFRQNFHNEPFAEGTQNGPITEGTYIQKLSMYIPSQNGFTQQLEIRRGHELLHFRWTSTNTDYCWNYKEGADRLCKPGPALSYDKWHNYVITLTKLPGNSDKWQIAINLDGRRVLQSDGSNNLPHLKNSYDDKGFGQILLGDECMKDYGNNLCDGYGTIYFDDVEAYNIR